MGGLVAGSESGSLLLRAPHSGLRNTLCHKNGAIGLCIEGGHKCIPAVTRGSDILGGDEWRVVDAQSTSHAVCPGHSVSKHVLVEVSREGGDSRQGLSPLQVLHMLANELPGDGLPSPLYLAVRPNAEERRVRLVHLIRVTAQGAIELESKVDIGELVRFASVNSDGSVRELTECVTSAREELQSTDGPLLCFSSVCCGRGTRFHGSPNQETKPLRDLLADIHVIGFFAGGEFGPSPYSEAGSDRFGQTALMTFTAIHGIVQFLGGAELES